MHAATFFMFSATAEILKNTHSKGSLAKCHPMMATPTGYKANRKSVAERRLEARKKVWRESDVPPWWARGQLADPTLLRQLLERLSPSGSNPGS